MHNELILGKKCNLKGDPSRIFPQKNELRRTIFFRVFLAHCPEGRQTDAAGARATPLFFFF